MSSPAPLFEGLRLIDLTHGYAGALTTMILTDNGASCTRVVPASVRYRGDPSDGVAGRWQWHRGKDLLELDLEREADRARLGQAAREADVVVESFRPGVAGRLGASYEHLSALNPRLVYCSISGFGTAGPYREVAGYDAVVQAVAGRMADFGVMFGAGRPVYTAVPSASFGASQAALQGICAALCERERTGRGRLVEATLLQGIVAYDMLSWLVVQLEERLPSLAAATAPLERPRIAYVPARTKDGVWLQFANWAPHLFWLELETLGLGDLRADPRFAGLPASGSNEAKDELWELILDRTATRTAEEWMAEAVQLATFGVDRYLTTEEGMDHPQARHNGQVVEAAHGDLGRTEQIGPLARFSPTGATGAPRTKPSGDAHAGPGPLAGVTVVELATQYAGPFGPTLLADLGARVVKVEPLTGDTVRENVLLAAKTLAGKESIAVDLKDPAGQEVVHRLVERADLFVHNFRPGVPERLGIDAGTLRKRNEQLVYVYAGSYGSDGPYARMPAYHTSMGAITGTAALQAGAGGIPAGDAVLSVEEAKEVSVHLTRANEGNPDASAALVVATALLMGLAARERGGPVLDITTTMIAANAYAMSDDWIRYAGKPQRPVPDADLLGLGPLYRLYETAEGWAFLACTNDTEWERLKRRLGAPLASDRFASAARRAEHAAELVEAIAEVLATRSAEDWERDLVPDGIACVRADRQGFAAFSAGSAQARAIGLTAEVDHPELGRIWRHAPIVSLSGSSAPARGPVALGHDTAAVLAELGYSEAEVGDLVRRRVVALEAPAGPPERS